jgi:hypothetical protein
MGKNKTQRKSGNAAERKWQGMAAMVKTLGN